MIRKALVPIAGLGKRLAPLTRAVPKGMFPMVDARDQVRPVLHLVLAEARSAGVEQAAIIVSPDHTDMLRRYFTAALRAGCKDLPPHIEYITQPSPMGFGDAVARAHEFIGHDEEAFMLLLGDQVYRAAAGAASCASQVAQAFESHRGVAMVGMQVVDSDELPRVGVGRGLPVAGHVYRCDELIEKPSLDVARAKLVTPGLPTDHFLAHCGIYVFTPEIFDSLQRLLLADRPAGEEIQFCDAQADLLRRKPGQYFLLDIQGRAYDTGTPSKYAQAFLAMRQA